VLILKVLLLFGGSFVDVILGFVESGIITLAFVGAASMEEKLM